MNTPRLPSGGNVDPAKLARIQALQQELQREYQGVGQVQGAQPVTSMGQQQGLVSGQEMVMPQNRMINAQSMQQQGPGGLRQVIYCNWQSNIRLESFKFKYIYVCKNYIHIF